MYNYTKVVAFVFDLCGNEFTTQLLIIALLFIPAVKRRRLFALRYISSFACIIGLQTLNRFGYFPVPAPVNYVLVLAMLIGATALCYHVNFVQSMFLGVCIYCSQFVLSSTAYIIAFTIMQLMRDASAFSYYYIIMPLLTAGFGAATYFTVVRRIKRHGELKFNSSAVVYIVITFALVATTLTHFARRELFWTLTGQIYLLTISVLFTCSTLLAGFMNLSKLRLEEENKILQQLLHKDKLRYEQAKLSNEKIMIKYHDMKQHMSQGIVDYESLSETEADNELLRCTYFTGNRALDIILSEKALICEKLGIRLVCTADGSAIDFMKSYHIYSFVGNALQNGIESLRKEKNEELKELTVSLTRVGNMCVFRAENYTSEKISISDGLPVTNKEDKENHGFGAKSMRNIAQRYGGKIKFLHENGVFTVVTMIPIPVTEKV